MKAFVTGASGFIGSHLVDALLDQGWTVRSLVHRKRLHRKNGVEVVQGDIRDFGLLKKAMEGTDVLFHLAAALGASLIGEGDFFDINSTGTRNVLQAAGETGVKRVIHLSSAGVLGIVGKGEIADEDYPLTPLSVYDRSKLEGESIAVEAAREGLDVVIIRPGWVYGPRDRRTFKFVRAIAGNRFILVTKGDARQTPVFVTDLVKGILLAAEKGQRGEIYHLAGNEALSVKEIADTIASACGKKIPPFSLPFLPVRLVALILEKMYAPLKKEPPLNMNRLSFFIHPKPLSIKKAERTLSFSPGMTFREGMELTVRWYRDHAWI